MSTSTDPNLMMVEASERAQSSQRTSDLILGPLLVVGGLVAIVFALLSLRAGIVRGFAYGGVGGLAALAAGGRQLYRGVVGARAA